MDGFTSRSLNAELMCIIQMWVGTAQSNIYKVSLGDLKPQLMTTCHYDRINDVAFPQYAVSVCSWSHYYLSCSGFGPTR